MVVVSISVVASYDTDDDFFESTGADDETVEPLDIIKSFEVDGKTLDEPPNDESKLSDEPETECVLAGTELYSEPELTKVLAEGALDNS